MEASWEWIAGTHAWQLTALSLLVLAVVRAVARNRPHLAYALWLVVILKSLTPPVWSSPSGVFCWLTPARPESVAAAVVPSTPPSSAAAVGTRNLAAADRPVVATTPRSATARERPADSRPAGERSPPASAPDPLATHATLRPAPTPLPSTSQSVLGRDTPGLTVRLVGGIWLAGAIGWLGLALWQWRACRRLLNESDPQATAQITPLVHDLVEQLERASPRGLPGTSRLRRVRVAVVTRHIGPAVFGAWNPVIVLPRLLVARQSTAQLRIILAHELLHIRRGDLWVGWLQLLSQAAWWFHPLVWLANRSARRAAEHCCDEAVVAELHCPPADYARGLLAILECKPALRAVPACPGMRPFDITSQRLERIMRNRHAQKRTPGWIWIVFILIAASALPGAAYLTAGQRGLVPRRNHRRETQQLPPATAARTSETSNLVLIETLLATGSQEAIDALRLPWRLVATNVGDPAPDHDVASPILPSPSPPAVAPRPRPPAAAQSPGNARPATSPQPTVERPTPSPTASHARSSISKTVPAFYAILSADDARNLLDQFQPGGSLETLAAPRISLTSGSPANVSCQTERALAGFAVQPDGQAIARPQIVREGWSLRLTPKLKAPSLVTLAVEAELARILRITQRDIPVLAGKPKDPPVQPVTRLTTEVPEIAATEISFALEVPVDSYLVVRGLPSVDENQEKGESLFVIRCRTAHARLEGKGVNSDAGVTGRIAIAPPIGSTAAPATTLRVYAVADLVIPPPRSISVTIADAQATVDEDQQAPDRSAAGRQTPEFDQLIELITSTVHPDSWKAGGGRGEFHIDERNFSLIVSQTPEIHHELTELLRNLRTANDVSVVLKTWVVRGSAEWLSERAELPRQPSAGGRTRGHWELTADQLRQFVTRAQGAERVSIMQLPKITALNGQHIELVIPRDPDDEPSATMEIVPMAATADQRVHLNLAFAAANARQSEVGIFVGALDAGRAVVLQPRKFQTAPGGVPTLSTIPHINRLFRNTSSEADPLETLIIVQTEIVVPAEDAR